MSAPTTSKNRGPRLPELCDGLFAFALSLRASRDPGDCKQLFDNATSLLEGLSQNARDAGVDSAHLEAARYALCALIDEIVLGSRWEIKGQWMSNPLQMAFFGDFTAGEQFFTRLDALQQDLAHNVDAVEVYAQCLAAGFRGKYADLAGMQKLDDMLAELGPKLRAARGVEGRALSTPHAPAAVLRQSVKRMPVWMMAVAGAALVLLMLFVLDALLASQASDFLVKGASRR